MFERLKISMETFQVEAVSNRYFWRGSFTPLGPIQTFLNDHQRPYVILREAEIVPLAPDRKVRGVRRDSMTANKLAFAFLSLLDPAEVQRIQLLPSKRPVIFYLEDFAVQGQLHVNVDAKDEDLIDETRLYYPVSEVRLFPIHPLAVVPTGQVPLLYLNVTHLQTYYVQNG